MQPSKWQWFWFLIRWYCTIRWHRGKYGWGFTVRLLLGGLAYQKLMPDPCSPALRTGWMFFLGPTFPAPGSSCWWWFKSFTRPERYMEDVETWSV